MICNINNTSLVRRVPFVSSCHRWIKYLVIGRTRVCWLPLTLVNDSGVNTDGSSTFEKDLNMCPGVGSGVDSGCALLPWCDGPPDIVVAVGLGRCQSRLHNKYTST